MSMLTEPLPIVLRVGGRIHRINPSYRVAIRAVTDSAVDALPEFYPGGVPVDVKAAITWFYWFLRCGKDPDPPAKGTQTDAQEKPFFSFDHDAEYIYAAFLDQYGVDLQKEPDLHWWKFHALLSGLREDNKFCQIMGYRGTEITSSMSAEARKHCQKMKDLYKLPPSKEELAEMERLKSILK